MNILVTGGAGYIGSHTAKLLARAGHVPVVLDNMSFGHDYAVKWGPFEKGDLGDGAFVKDVFKRHKIDAVVHFAAHTFVGESMTEPRKYFHNNTVNALNLLDAMLDAGVKEFQAALPRCTGRGLQPRVLGPGDAPALRRCLV